MTVSMGGVCIFLLLVWLANITAVAMSVARSAIAVVLVVLLVCRYSSAQDCSGAPSGGGRVNR